MSESPNIVPRGQKAQGIEERVSYREALDILCEIVAPQQMGSGEKRQLRFSYVKNEEVEQARDDVIRIIREALKLGTEISDDDIATAGNSGWLKLDELNISARYIAMLDEKGAEALLRTINPYIQNETQRKAYIEYLSELTGITLNSGEVHRSDRGATTEAVYTAWFYNVKNRGIGDPVQYLADTLNKALGSNLFRQIAGSPGRGIVIEIGEHDMPALLANPNLDRIREIFQDPRGAARADRSISWAGWATNSLDLLLHGKGQPSDSVRRLENRGKAVGAIEDGRNKPGGNDAGSGPPGTGGKGTKSSPTR